MKYYVWENVIYGKKLNGDPLMIEAFKPLKIVEELSSKIVVVKKYGKGQKHEFVIRKELLCDCLPWD